MTDEPEEDILTQEIELDPDEMWRSFEVTREILRNIAFENGLGGITVCDCADCVNARNA